MKEYIRLFETPSTANDYLIEDIPFITTIKRTNTDDVNLHCNTPAMKIETNGDTAGIVENTITITGTWNTELTNNNVRVVISGEVTLNGKTDCYSLMFEDENSHLTINAGARLRIWLGGIVNNDCSIVNYLTMDFGYSIVSIDDEPPQLLIHPNVTVNNTPKATIRIGQYHVGKNSNNVWYWQKWGSLVDQITSWTKEGPESSYPTYLYAWDYENNDWKNMGGPGDIKKFNGISTTPTNNYPTDFTIIYEGNLLSNQNYEIQSYHGWDYLANSYPGKINLTKFMEQSQVLDRAFIYLREPNTPQSQELDFKHNTYYIYPGQCFISRVSQQMGPIIFNYKNMVWDPSFEEEVTPIRGLMKGALTSAKSEELPDDPIFHDPEPQFSDMADNNTK